MDKMRLILAGAILASIIIALPANAGSIYVNDYPNGFAVNDFTGTTYLLNRFHWNATLKRTPINFYNNRNVALYPYDIYGYNPVSPLNNTYYINATNAMIIDAEILFTLTDIEDNDLGINTGNYHSRNVQMRWDFIYWNSTYWNSLSVNKEAVMTLIGPNAFAMNPPWNWVAFKPSRNSDTNCGLWQAAGWSIVATVGNPCDEVPMSNASTWYFSYEEEAPPGTATITGYVQDSLLHDPILAADVSVHQESNWFNTSTNISGGYLISGVPTGINITLTAAKEGYINEPYEFDPVDAITYYKNLELIPHSVSSCNLTAMIQDRTTGNLITHSYFHIYDLLSGVGQTFYLPNGIGNISIPVIGNEYVWNGSASYYELQEAVIPYTNGTPIYNCNNILTTSLIPTAGSVTNTTLNFNVQGLDCFNAGHFCVVPGAQVTLTTDGQIGITNSAGSVSFPVLNNSAYSYTVTKMGYLGAHGNVTIGSESFKGVIVYLPSGTIPTATTTTPSPYIPHDTTSDLIDLLLNNASSIGGLLLVAFIIGVLKIMGK